VSGPAAARPSASPRTCRGRSAPLAGSAPVPEIHDASCACAVPSSKASPRARAVSTRRCPSVRPDSWSSASSPWPPTTARPGRAPRTSQQHQPPAQGVVAKVVAVEPEVGDQREPVVGEHVRRVAGQIMRSRAVAVAAQVREDHPVALRGERPRWPAVGQLRPRCRAARAAAPADARRPSRATPAPLRRGRGSDTREGLARGRYPARPRQRNDGSRVNTSSTAGAKCASGSQS
jgi:hypothetical protein